MIDHLERLFPKAFDSLTNNYPLSISVTTAMQWSDESLLELNRPSTSASRHFGLLALLMLAILPLSVCAMEPAFQDLSMERLLTRGRELRSIPVSTTHPSKLSNTSVTSNNVKSSLKPSLHSVKDTFQIQALPPTNLGHLLGTRASHQGISKIMSNSTDKQHSVDYVPLKMPDELPTISRIIEFGRVPPSSISPLRSKAPMVKAKALLCLDCGSNQVLLDKNSDLALPIASITKLVTAMVVIDEMDLDRVCEVPRDIKKIEKHVVGIRPGDRITVRDLLHGLLIESGNDCAEVLARHYPKGGRSGFLAAMQRKANEIGATKTRFYTPSGLDVKLNGTDVKTGDPAAKLSNTASAYDVALIARKAFSYPLIGHIARLKTYSFRTVNANPREYKLVSNDKLLERGLPLEGAKTGYTDAAGKCIVALFKDHENERLVVVLNAPRHFNAAEKIYRWASQK